MLHVDLGHGQTIPSKINIWRRNIQSSARSVTTLPTALTKRRRAQRVISKHSIACENLETRSRTSLSLKHSCSSNNTRALLLNFRSFVPMALSKISPTMCDHVFGCHSHGNSLSPTIRKPSAWLKTSNVGQPQILAGNHHFVKLCFRTRAPLCLSTQSCHCQDIWIQSVLSPLPLKVPVLPLLGGALTATMKRRSAKYFAWLPWRQGLFLRFPAQHPNPTPWHVSLMCRMTELTLSVSTVILDTWRESKKVDFKFDFHW